MKAAELRELTMEELKAEHIRLLKSHLNMRIQRSSGMLSTNHKLKEIRRDIARVKTIMREKNHAGN